MNELHNYGLIRTEKIKQIIEENTKLEGTNTIKYKGPAVETTPQFMLEKLTNGDEIYGLHDD